MILFRLRGVRITEAWFDEPAPSAGADVVYYVQRPAPIPGIPNQEKHTLLMDLEWDEEALFAAVNADSRTKIRRARDKDGITCASVPTDSTNLSSFCEFYKRFAEDKGLNPAARPYLEALIAAGRLDLSQACDPSNGEVLVWHAHLVSSGRARLLYSASLFRESEDNQRRNMIGRANRLLHWQDAIRFKGLQFSTYDWGGWYAGDTDDAKLQINRFKKEFGGAVVKEWCGEAGITWRGRLALRLRRMLGRSE